MKELVTVFHALPINKLARLLLMPFSKFEWAWPTHRGAEQSRYRSPCFRMPYTCSFHWTPVERTGGSHISGDIELGNEAGSSADMSTTCWSPLSQERSPFRCRMCCDLAYPAPYQLEIGVMGGGAEASRTARAGSAQAAPGDENLLSGLCETVPCLIEARITSIST